jgi:hypothetical protein
MLKGSLAKSIVVSASEARRADPKWWLARMAPKRFGDPTRRIDHTSGGEKLQLVNPDATVADRSALSGQLALGKGLA